MLLYMCINKVEDLNVCHTESKEIKFDDKEISKRSSEDHRINTNSIFASYTFLHCSSALSCTHTHASSNTHVCPASMTLPKMRSRQAPAVEADSCNCGLLIISPPLFISSAALADSLSLCLLLTNSGSCAINSTYMHHTRSQRGEVCRETD